MAEEKKIEKKADKEIIGEADKIRELKIEMLKNVMKRKQIKREIARLLTLQNKVGEKK